LTAARKSKPERLRAQPGVAALQIGFGVPGEQTSRIIEPG